MLYDAGRVFINGSAADLRGPGSRLLRALADNRALPAAACATLDEPTADLLHQWYCDGYLDTGH